MTDLGQRSGAAADEYLLIEREHSAEILEIGSYFTTDLVYRLSLPSELTLTSAVFNVADRDPPAVRFTDYSYDPFFGNPMGRAFKLGLTKQFR